MGEENNNGIWFHGDGILRSVSDTFSTYEVSRPDIVNVPNVSGELVIPELLDKVLKKTINGLLNIQVDGYQRVYNNYIGNPSHRYTVYLVLTFPIGIDGNKFKLGELINDCFHMMYSDITNVHFEVSKLTCEMRNYDEEFFEFFKKK